MQQGGSQTLSATVDAGLRQEILDGTLEPGGKLRIGMVAARYGVTSTPVREALNLLTSEGFVLGQEQPGFTVAPATDTDLQQLTETRCWVDEVALRQAKRHATPAWAEGILLALHRLSRTARSTETETFQEDPASEGVHRTFTVRCWRRARSASCWSSAPGCATTLRATAGWRCGSPTRTGTSGPSTAPAPTPPWRATPTRRSTC